MENYNSTVSGDLLLETSRKAVYGYVNKVFPDFFRLEDVEDMIQDTAVKMLTARTPYDPERGSFYNLVWVAAKRVVLTRAARLKRERSLFTSIDRLYSADSDDPDAEYRTFDTLSALGEADSPADSQLIADELQESFRSTLKGERDWLIFDWLNDDLDDGEIADRLGISKAAAYTAICRVRTRIRDAA